MIGSICVHDARYWLFYADVDVDGKAYLYFRTATGLADFRDDRSRWSDATRISGPLMPGIIIRVAKARDGLRWAVLYNGYRPGPKGLREDLSPLIHQRP